MSSAKSLSLTIYVLIFLSVINLCTAARIFDRRSDLHDTPPISASGWTVPLQGGMTCQTEDHCTDTLSPPATDRILQVLAIGHGFFKYSCASSGLEGPPDFISQSTELYDASQLVANLPDEESFHELIPKFCEFDYGQIDNSTLNCIGSVGTVNGGAVINLYGRETLQVILKEIINPTKPPEFNGLWAHSSTTEGDWDIYRVEMAGGAVPHICEGQDKIFEIEYAAEYWMYHA